MDPNRAIRGFLFLIHDISVLLQQLHKLYVEGGSCLDPHDDNGQQDDAQVRGGGSQGSEPKN
jgi:hypothetical protein